MLPETTETVDDLAEPDNEEPYPSDLHNNLVFRYEEPTVHSRWDKPLFTVPWTDATPPIEEIWTATTGIAIEKNHPEANQNSLAALLHTNPNSTPPLSPNNNPSASPPPQSDTASIAFTIRSTAPGNNTTTNRLGRPRIKPHQATVLPTKADSGALYNYEKRTSAIVSTIRAFTQTNPSAEAVLAQQRSQTETHRADEEGISISVAPHASIPIFVPAHIVRSSPTDELAGAGGILTLPRLQRLRRQWISQNRVYIGMTHNPVQGGLGVDQVGDAFVRYLNFEFAGDTGE